MHDFVYRRMQGVDETVAQLQTDDEAKLLAGGMTLLPTMKQRLAQPSQLLDLAGIDDLQGIECSEKAVTIGATTTHASVAHSTEVRQAIPALSSLANSIGDPQVRNRGTLGGSVANADPSADYPAAVLALKATVFTNTREIPADDFFIDLFETALEEDELITRITFSRPQRAAYASFRNPASRYAVVGVFIADFKDHYRVAVTGAAGSVFCWSECESALMAGTDEPDMLNLSLPDLEFNEDIHATADYRSHLVRVMTSRAIQRL
jgi:carbon-monoxide dehydrogenase medium subunit